MAIIKCSECGKNISNKASSCVNCGNPIKTTKTTKGKSSADNNPNKPVIIGLIFIVVITFLLIIWKEEQRKKDRLISAAEKAANKYENTSSCAEWEYEYNYPSCEYYDNPYLECKIVSTKCARYEN